MPIERPWFGEYGWVLDAILMGGEWPELDESAIFTLADRLSATTDQLAAAIGPLDDARRAVADCGISLMLTAYDRAAYDDIRCLGEKIEDLRALTEDIAAKGNATEYTKISMVVTGYLTILQVFTSLLLAFFSGGVSTGLLARTIASGAERIAVTRATLLTRLGRAVPLRMSGTARMANSTRAARPLATTAPTSVRRTLVESVRAIPRELVASAASLRHSWPKIARSMAAEVLEGVVLVNGISSAIQWARGHGYHPSNTATEFISSLLGGALGVPVGAFTHGITKPLWAPVEAGIARLLPTARNSFNSWLPPGIGGTAKWLSDAIVFLPGATIANAVVSPFAGWFAQSVVTGQWNLADLSRAYGDTAGTSALSAVGRSTSPGIIELSRGARATVDYALHGPSQAEIARVERINAAIGFGAVEPYSLRLVDVYHDIPDAIDRHFAPEYFADRFESRVGPPPSPTPDPNRSPGETMAMPDSAPDFFSPSPLEPVVSTGSIPESGELAATGNNLLNAISDSEFRAQHLLAQLRDAADNSALIQRAHAHTIANHADAAFADRNSAVRQALLEPGANLPELVGDQFNAEATLVNALDRAIGATNGAQRAQTTAAAAIAYGDLAGARHGFDASTGLPHSIPARISSWLGAPPAPTDPPAPGMWPAVVTADGAGPAVRLDRLAAIRYAQRMRDGSGF